VLFVAELEQERFVRENVHRSSRQNRGAYAACKEKETRQGHSDVGVGKPELKGQVECHGQRRDGQRLDEGNAEDHDTGNGDKEHDVKVAFQQFAAGLSGDVERPARLSLDSFRVPLEREHRVHAAQVLAEFYVTTTRKLARPLDAAAAAEQISDLSAVPVVPIDGELVRTAVQLSQAHQLSLWDAMVVRAAVRGGCDTLVTEDLPQGTVLDGVRVFNPFAAPPD
jgi:predicted nucleic acid-binding protein